MINSTISLVWYHGMISPRKKWNEQHSPEWVISNSIIMFGWLEEMERVNQASCLSCITRHPSKIKLINTDKNVVL